MINMFFFLKFRTQLNRINPQLIHQIDDLLNNAIADAGGSITGSRSVISAKLDEDTIGFWLDMYILIENIMKFMDSSSEYFGYSLCLCSSHHDSSELLSRFLSSCGGGVFLDEKAAEKFSPYAVIENSSVWLRGRKANKYGSDKFFRVKGLKHFKPAAKNNKLLNEIIEVMDKHSGKNILILGNDYLYIHKNLNDYCRKINGDFPPLTICFGSIGLGALVNAWSASIRSLSGEQSSEEIDSLWEFLFSERIRDEVSGYVIQNIRRYLFLLFEYYCYAAQKKKRKPVLVLANIHLAGKRIGDLVQESLAQIAGEHKQNMLVFGTGDSGIHPKRLNQWENVFNITEKTDGEIHANTPKAVIPELTQDLWEIVYTLLLFRRYFSPELFQRLFEEEEKNPVMITRAFSILHTLGVIDNPREPWIVSRYYEDNAQQMLGDRAARLRAVVCERLLNWAARRNITPCFRLLTIIASLGGRHDDDILLLKSISSDIVNQTTSGLEQAFHNRLFEEFVSEKKAGVLQLIYRTSKALYSGNDQDVNKAFDAVDSGCDDYPVLKSQIIVNLCCYFLGRYDMNASSARAKEAIVMGQSNNFCLPQVYRLFSLVCLSQRKIAETIEYLSFALTIAEKNGNLYELGVCSYYAAAAQFLYGDIYNALRHINKSVKYLLAAGYVEWSDRSRFLEGRLNFELGNYREAHDIFAAIRSKPSSETAGEKDSLLTAWIFRCQIYLSCEVTVKPNPANHDAQLFQIEAAYLTGNYETAVKLAASTGNPYSKEKFLFTERPGWQSGFTQCEQLYFSQGEIQDRIKRLFQSLAKGFLSAHEREEALDDIQRLLRDEGLCEMDPWDAIYFYGKYLILEQAKTDPVDKNTAISIAVRRLQRRASRIEDAETRAQYLNGSRWVQELTVAAKKYKLI